MMDRSKQLYRQAREVLPGGVNSPVRAFGAVGMEPLFLHSAQGCTVTDVDGGRYTDYVGSWGPMILGHNHPAVREAVVQAAGNGLSFGAPCPAEVDVAALMCRMVPDLEMVRMVNSGTEAVMSALRLARAATGREKVVKFEGCYHGHGDAMLVKAGSGALTTGMPSSAGVPGGVARDTLTATYNDLDSVEAVLCANRGEVAAVIVEPVAANMGVVPPQRDFLPGLRRLCDAHGCLLLFDEVITGFRLAPGGAQEHYGVRADLVTYGKIIGGGMPVGAYGGGRRWMEQVSPCGPVYQAGTLSGNPVAMAAGLAQLRILAEQPGLYRQLASAGRRLAEGLAAAARDSGRPLTVNRAGSLVCAFFTGEPVQNYNGALQSDCAGYAAYFRQMLRRGQYLAPSQFEAMFLSAAHTREIIDETVRCARQALGSLS